MGFAKVCAVDHVPAGEMAAFYVDDVEVLIVRTAEAVHAFDGICPHEAFGLVDGIFDGATIMCIAHRWTFNATTGQGIDPLNCRLTEFPLAVEDGVIYVDVDGDDPKATT